MRRIVVMRRQYVRRAQLSLAELQDRQRRRLRFAVRAAHQVDREFARCAGRVRRAAKFSTE
ncbi:hypothetical protein [Burkholderia ambifaria]|uniref:hypothetical protein n=1 Tax=Burkholderia ambifaria TaxID=152480 RepID=UPI00158ABBFB|nr:hypothetical protein [Burkholderia ambifaria]MBR8344144.1 hypothetical protein [Burkholderia ambifaria]